MVRTTASFVALLLVAVFPTHLVADDLPRATPAEVGLSAERLAKIRAMVETQVEAKEIAGAVTVVARKGKVAYFEAFGTFREDSIVRIYSMTKPITVATALTLVDEGRLKLDDPVSKYLPSFAALKVQGSDAPARPMTVQHLMMHTSGLTYGYFGNTGVDRAYREAKLLARDTTLEAMVAKLAKIPLLAEPGERWHYSVSTDVLARVIEVAGGKAFDVILQERILDPLGMSDTGFSVPQDKRSRLVANYGPGGRVIESPETSPYLVKPGLLSGGGGLVSTARDFTIFALMLASGGTWNGKRILRAETVETMTTNHLRTDQIPIRFGWMPLVGLGFGLGVSVRVGAASPAARIGEWGWAGAASTTFVVVPEDDLVMVSLIQRMPMWFGFDAALRPLVYAAVEREPAAASVGGDE